MKTEKIQYGAHPSMYYMVHFPQFPVSLLPIIILIHGGYFKPKNGLELMDDMVLDLTESGYTVINLEYPRVGEHLTHLLMIKAIFNAYDHIAASFHSKRITVIGHSAGGYYALMLALRSNFTNSILHIKGNPPECPPRATPHKVIALAPLSNLWQGAEDGYSNDHDAIQNFMNADGFTAEKPDYEFVSPSSYETFDCEVQIFHGYDDIDVPIEHSQSFMETYRPHVYLHDLVRTDHFDLINPDSHAWEKIKNYI